MGRTLKIAYIAATIACCAVSPASAQECLAPPGTSAVDEYCETVPAPGGDQRVWRGDSRSAPPDIGRRATQQLLRRGRDGEAVLEEVARGPKPSRSTDDQADTAASADPVSHQDAVEDDPTIGLQLMGQVLASGPSLGGGYPLIVLAAILGMFGWAWRDFRREQ
jgi:hypothetical protein